MPNHICSTCGYTTSDKSNFTRHVLTHREVKRFACDTCGQRYARNEDLNIHIKNIHSGVNSEDANTQQFDPSSLPALGSPSGSSSTQPAFDFSSLPALGSPSGSSSTQPAFDFSSLPALGSPSSPSSTQPAAEAMQIDASSSSSSSASPRSHTPKAGVKPFKCPQCNYAPNKQSNLTRHILKHGEVKRFACTWTGCSQRYTRKANLNIHIKNIHSGVNSEDANTQQVAAASSSSSSSSSSEKRFKCSQCNYATNDKSNFSRHRRKHTGEKRFACTWKGCNKRFGQNYDLNKHIRRIHSGVNPADANTQQFDPSSLPALGSPSGSSSTQPAFDFSSLPALGSPFSSTQPEAMPEGLPLSFDDDDLSLRDNDTELAYESTGFNNAADPIPFSFPETAFDLTSFEDTELPFLEATDPMDDDLLFRSN